MRDAVLARATRLPAPARAVLDAAAVIGVLRELGYDVQWVQSYVTDDKITCIYIAPDAESVREHARSGGFPANQVLEVRTAIDPTTAEAVR